MRIATLTGWRRGEVVPLRWAQVDWEAGVVRLEPGTTKNRAVLLESQCDYTRSLEREAGRIKPWVFHRGGA